ncbi:TPA: hypothetical protein ACPY9J_002292 [Yersinia enterocolitica]
MTKKILRGSDLERWRLDQGLVVGTAVECFGLQKKKWERMTSNNEIITSRRVINLYLMYTEHPETMPIAPTPDYELFFQELGLEHNTQGWRTFAKLLGVSLTSAIRILDNNSASREVERFVQALERTGCHGKTMRKLMEDISSKGEVLATTAAMEESSKKPI